MVAVLGSGFRPQRRGGPHRHGHPQGSVSPARTGPLVRLGPGRAKARCQGSNWWMPSGVYVASVEGMVTDDVFAVIAEATRRDILIALRKGDKAVGELVQELEASQPTISKHLKVLREADLVSMRAQGQKRYYTLNPKPLAGVATWLQAFDVGPAATADAAAALHPEAGPAAVPEGLAAAVPQPAVPQPAVPQPVA